MADLPVASTVDSALGLLVDAERKANPHNYRERFSKSGRIDSQADFQRPRKKYFHKSAELMPVAWNKLEQLVQSKLKTSGPF